MPTIHRENVSEDIFVKYLLSRYRREYFLTYYPSEENVRRALEVYRFCMREGLFRSVDECVAEDLKRREAEGRPTYSYRRMENFIKELGLYEVGGYWLVAFYLVKFSLRYKSARSDVEIDSTFTLYAPLDPYLEFHEESDDLMTNDVNFILLNYLGLHFELISRLEPYRKDWEIIESGLGNIETTYIHYKETKQIVDIDDIVIVKKGKPYYYDVSATSDYYLFLPFNVIPKSVEMFRYEGKRRKGR